MGGIVAWVVERTDTPGGAVFHVLALMSFAIPGLLMAMAWIFIFSPNIGWGNALLKSLFGLAQAPVDIYSMGGMIWALSSHYFPLAYLALGPALRALDMRMEEAGAGVGRQRYWQIARSRSPAAAAAGDAVDACCCCSCSASRPTRCRG